MREGWTYKKLGEVASYINGYAFKPEQWKESGTPIIRIQNLNNPEAPYNYYDGEVPEKVKIQNGDLLISWSASLGAYIWDGGAAFLNQHIFKVEFDKTDIDKMYLKYAVTSKLEAMANLVHGATMKHIVKKDFDNTLIPYPSKSQQEAIVSELDEINSLLALKREQLQKYDKLAQSLFYEMFGDPVENEKGWDKVSVSSFSDITDFVANGSFATIRENVQYLEEDGYAILVRMVDNSNNFDEKKFVYVDEHSYNFLAKSKLFGGEIIMNNVGARLATSFICPNLGRPMTLGPNSIVIRTQCNVFNQNMFSLASSIDYIRSIVGSTAMPKFNKTQFKQLLFIQPPLPLQQQFASRIEQIESQKQQVQAAIEKLETLLASRMQYWFE